MLTDTLRILLGLGWACGMISCAAPTPYVMTLKDGRRIAANSHDATAQALRLRRTVRPYRTSLTAQHAG